MIKKIYLLLLFLLPFATSAQLAVGDWRVHSLFGATLSNIIETDSKVYIHSTGSLYSYDKDELELESYTHRNKLSDIGIKDIYYNYDKKYLLVVYENSNIDFLYDDGKVVNIPDIKNTIMSVTKSVKTVSFAGDYVYLGTDFGYLILNEAKCEVKESHIFNVAISGIAVVGDMLVVADSKNIYWDNKDKQIIDLSSFSHSAARTGTKQILTTGDNSFVVYTGWGVGVTFNEDKSAVTQTALFNGNLLQIQYSGDGVMLATSSGTIRHFDASFAETRTITLPSQLIGARFSSLNGDDKYWILSSEGIKNSQLGADGTETVLADYFRPNASSVSQPYYMLYNKGLNKLYVMNKGTDQYVSAYNTPATINTLDGMNWEDITPTENVPAYNASNVNDGVLRDPYQPIFDPEDPETYYIGSWFSGAYRITGDKVTAHYYTDNCPVTKNWRCNIPSLQFDANKNLWLIEANNSGSVTEPVMVLTRDKQSLETITIADWHTLGVSGFDANKKMHFHIAQKSNVKLLTDGKWGSVLVAFNENGTFDNSADDDTKVFTSLTDQDEKTYEWEYINCFIEDANGKVWMGTSNGVVEFNPANIFNDNFRINRLKIPRNDGTSYADYLLENENVMCMDIDGANRKWIGTQASGLFLVSADGTEVIQHFTTDNSYLPSNYITSVACNPNSNSVYIGTLSGIVEYSGDSSPAESDYSNVYAYPNPVRPEYTGWITVKGLMDNSLVKITDAVGNVVFTGRSTGGMLIWDGNGPNGEPVKTGVYYVLASQNENDTSSGAVTKILVVR